MPGYPQEMKEATRQQHNMIVIWVLCRDPQFTIP